MQRTIVKYRGLELLCNPDTVTKYREEKLMRGSAPAGDGGRKADGLGKVIQTEEIFTSVSKGTRAKDTDLSSVFGTTNVQACIEIMLQKGTYQISAAERKERVDAKRAEIIGYITKNYLDARNKLPIPHTRVEAALEQLKIRVDAETSTDKQLAQILKKLPSALPLKKQQGLHGALRIPHQYTGGVQSIVRKFGTVDFERYDSAGAIFEVTVAGGETENFLSAVGKLTKDNYQFDIIND